MADEPVEFAAGEWSKTSSQRLTFHLVSGADGTESKTQPFTVASNSHLLLSRSLEFSGMSLSGYNYLPARRPVPGSNSPADRI